MNKKTVGTFLAGIGTALAITVAIGAGGTSTPFTVGGERLAVSPAQWTVMVNAAVTSGLWKDKATEIDRLVLEKSDTEIFAVIVGTVVGDTTNPPKGARGIPASYVTALKEAAAAK